MKAVSIGEYPAIEYRLLRLSDCVVSCNTLDTPERVYEYWAQSIETNERFNSEIEQLVVVMLNTRRRAIGHVLLATGTVDTLLVHPREVFRPALVANASAIVICHNHPGGDPTPSEADIKVTRDLMRAGQLLKTDLLDHVIIGSKVTGLEQVKRWSSLRELGYFYSS